MLVCLFAAFTCETHVKCFLGFFPQRWFTFSQRTVLSASLHYSQLAKLARQLLLVGKERRQPDCCAFLTHNCLLSPQGRGFQKKSMVSHHVEMQGWGELVQRTLESCFWRIGLLTARAAFSRLLSPDHAIQRVFHKHLYSNIASGFCASRKERQWLTVSMFLLRGFDVLSKKGDPWRR